MQLDTRSRNELPDSHHMHKVMLRQEVHLLKGKNAKRFCIRRAASALVRYAWGKMLCKQAMAMCSRCDFEKIKPQCAVQGKVC